jgi:hypothetical protein
MSTLSNTSAGSRSRSALSDAGRPASDNRQDEDRQGRQEQSREQRETDTQSRRSERRQAGLSSIGRLAPMPIAMSNNGLVMEQIRADFVEYLPAKDDANVPDVKVIPINKESASLPYSVIVVAGIRKGREDLGVAHHTLIIAGSSDPIQPYTDSFRSEQRRIVPTPDIAYNKKMRERVLEALHQAYPGKKDADFISADAEVIIAGLPSADKDNGKAIGDVVKNTLAALQVALNKYDKDVPELSLVEEDNSYNQIHIQHRQNHILDRGNLPVRADSIIELICREHAPSRERRNDPFQNAVDGQRLVRISGFHDFVYSPHKNARTEDNMSWSRRRASDEDYMFYALRYVITDIDTMDFSLASMLLAIAVANAAGDQAEILRAFEPNKSLQGDDIRDIGALAYEPNIEENSSGVGTLPSTKTSDFTTAKLKALLSVVTHPGMILAMDIPDCASGTWKYVNLLALAEGGTKESKRVHDTLDRMTGGHFGDLYGPNEPVIDSYVERIFNGFYVEGDNRLDIRDIDRLAILNMSRPEKLSDLETVRRWDIAASNQDDQSFAQSEQYEILTQCLQNVTITGTSQRISFDAKFNSALVESFNRCGLSLNPSSSARDGFQKVRSAYGHIDSILNRPGSSGLYNNQRRGGRDRDDDRYSSFGRGRNENRWDR